MLLIYNGKGDRRRARPVYSLRAPGEARIIDAGLGVAVVRRALQQGRTPQHPDRPALYVSEAGVQGMLAAFRIAAE